MGVNMCLGIPMQVKVIDGYAARCEARGVERDVSLLMLPEGSVKTGDYVVVHLGHAIQTVSAEEAIAAWEIYDQMLAAESSP
jgi:hydrogenase expression/formation protein HypC